MPALLFAFTTLFNPARFAKAHAVRYHPQSENRCWMLDVSQDVLDSYSLTSDIQHLTSNSYVNHRANALARTQNQDARSA